MAALGQEYMMCYGKEPFEVRGGGSGYATIIEFCNM